MGFGPRSGGVRSTQLQHRVGGPTSAGEQRVRGGSYPRGVNHDRLDPSEPLGPLGVTGRSALGDEDDPGTATSTSVPSPRAGSAEPADVAAGTDPDVPTKGEDLRAPDGQRGPAHQRESAVPSAPADPPPPLPAATALHALLPPDIDLRTGRGLRHEAARPVWLGVVWGRLGRGDLAWAHLDRVGLPELQPWIAAERGRILRELGLHAAAERLEWPALARAEDPVDAAMLRVSLTADAVGLGDLDRAERRLLGARGAVAQLPDSARAARQRLRLTWVEVEVAYLAGREPDPTRLPWWRYDDEVGDPALHRDHASGSSFHTAKGLLFGGVVRGDVKLLDAALDQAPPALAWAVHLARVGLGVAGAEEQARRAWREVVPPPGWEAEVAATLTAQRLGTEHLVGRVG